MASLPLVLLPGLLCDARLWRDPAAALADLTPVHHADLTLDDTYRLWSAFKATYALSVGYLADTAIVYSEPDPTEVSLVEELELATRLLPPTFGPG